MNSNRTEWAVLVGQLERGLSLQTAVRKLGKNYGIARYWLKRLGYQYSDARTAWTVERKRKSRWFDHDRIDWSQPNVQIARQFKVSRERIRQLRNKQNNHKS